ncbi:MAG: hypothetical protein ACD_60C00029G0007 [uncultured bacterium]|nr:MAG: hypothetical protein ACD_60C00029G0007 [uncultured bacterium]
MSLLLKKELLKALQPLLPRHKALRPIFNKITKINIPHHDYLRAWACVFFVALKIPAILKDKASYDLRLFALHCEKSIKIIPGPTEKMHRSKGR